MRVILSPGAITVATTLACVRQGVNREAGRTNLKAGQQDVMTTELVGAFGEVAFCKWANIYPDLSTHLRAGSPDATFGSLTVDVKTTRGTYNPRWKADVRPDKAFDVYVFTAADWATVDLCGWLPGEAVQEVMARNDGWIVTKELRSIEDLKEYDLQVALSRGEYEQW